MIGVNRATFIYYDLIGQTNNIVNKWATIGLLEGLSKRKGIKCAIYFEECFKFLSIEENNSNVIIFAVIRKIINKIKIDFNFSIHALYIETKDIYDIYLPILMSKYNYINNIDYEAELCNRFSKYYINKLNKNNK
jgi:hypothetical protein